MVIIPFLENFGMFSTTEGHWLAGKVYGRGEIIPGMPVYESSDSSGIKGPIKEVLPEGKHRYIYIDQNQDERATIIKPIERKEGTRLLVETGTLPPFHDPLDYDYDEEYITHTSNIHRVDQSKKKRLIEKLMYRINYQRQEKEKQRKAREETSTTTEKSRSKRDVIKLKPIMENEGTGKISSRIDNVDNHNYFRHVGTIIGAASFAHLAFEIKFDKIQKQMEKGCSCAYLDPREISPNVAVHDSTSLGVKIRFNSIKSLCEEAFDEIREAKYSFTTVDTEMKEHLKTASENENLKELFPSNAQTEKLKEEAKRISIMKKLNKTNNNEIPKSLKKLTKRGAPLIIGGLLISSAIGIFGGYQLNNLWNHREDVSQIMEVIDEHDLKIFNLETEQKALEMKLAKIHTRLKFLADYTLMNTMADECEAEVELYRGELRRILDGIYLLLHHRLHPSFVNPEALQEKLKIIDQKATNRHQHLGISTVNELYQMETSYLSNANDTIIAMVHVPLYQLSTIMSLWEYIPTPSKSHLNLNDQRGKAFHFRPDKRYLAKTSGNYYRELTQADLAACHRTRDTYVCDHLSALKRTDTKSCLNSLFDGNDEGIVNNCEIELISEDTSEVVQIDAHRFLVYLPTDTRLEITCEAYRMHQAQTKRVSGLNMITIPDGCVGTTPEYRFNSVGNLGTYHTFVGAKTSMNVSNVLAHISPEEMKRILDQMEADREARISLPKIQRAFYHRRHWITHDPWNLLQILFSLGLATIVAMVLATVCGCLPPYWYRRFFRCCTIREPPPVNQTSRLSYWRRQQRTHDLAALDDPPAYEPEVELKSIRESTMETEINTPERETETKFFIGPEPSSSQPLIDITPSQPVVVTPPQPVVVQNVNVSMDDLRSNLQTTPTTN